MGQSMTIGGKIVFGRKLRKSHDPGNRRNDETPLVERALKNHRDQPSDRQIRKRRREIGEKKKGVWGCVLERRLVLLHHPIQQESSGEDETNEKGGEGAVELQL